MGVANYLIFTTHPQEDYTLFVWAGTGNIRSRRITLCRLGGQLAEHLIWAGVVQCSYVTRHTSLGQGGSAV